MTLCELAANTPVPDVFGGRHPNRPFQESPNRRVEAFRRFLESRSVYGGNLSERRRRVCQLWQFNIAHISNQLTEDHQGLRYCSDDIGVQPIIKDSSRQPDPKTSDS